MTKNLKFKLYSRRKAYIIHTTLVPTLLSKRSFNRTKNQMQRVKRASKGQV
jgi:hypothetical protein